MLSVECVYSIDIPGSKGRVAGQHRISSAKIAKINGMKAADVLAGLTSNEPATVSVAITTLNALSACCWDRGRTDH